jgi:pimeloyl-ACP methyl ester carboxylesterase
MPASSASKARCLDDSAADEASDRTARPAEIATRESARIRSARGRKRLGPVRAVFLALLLGAVISGIVYRSWIDAQARTVGVLALAGKVPVLAWMTRGLTDTPHIRDELVADVPTTVYRPGGGDRWPALVFLNGVTARGRHHPEVERLADALARVGFLVLVPDPPGLASGEITDRTLTATVAVVRAAADGRDAAGRRVGLVGVSVGASLGLLAAEQPSLANRVTLVAGIAPYTDLENVTRLATTGYVLDDGQLVRYETASFLPLVIARSLVAALPASRDRSRLLAELLRLHEGSPDPLALFRRLQPGQLVASARPVVSLLANRDTARFDRLYAALPADFRASIIRLSPLAGAGRLRAPVEIASAPHDKYFPLAETRALVRANRHSRVRLTVTSTLHHAVPNFSLSDFADLFRFDGWAVRSLRGLGG